MVVRFIWGRAKCVVGFIGGRSGRVGVGGFVRGHWVHSSGRLVHCGSRFIQGATMGRWVHSGSLGSFVGRLGSSG